MSINTYLRRLRRWAKPAVRTHQARPRLGVENLEDRLVPSTVSILGNVLTYQAGADETNKLEIGFSATDNMYTFTDTGKDKLGGNIAILLGQTASSSVKVDSSTFSTIEVKLDNKDDALTVLYLDATKSLDAFGEADNDTITIGGGGRGMDDIQGSITADGGTPSGTGKDKLILVDRDGTPGGPIAAPNHFAYFVNGADVDRQLQNFSGTTLGEVTVSSANMGKLELRTSNHGDTITVNSTVAATPVEIKAGDGDDTISAGDMDLLAGPVTVRGEDGTDTFTINDTGAASSRNYVLNTDSVVQGTTSVTLDALEGLTINGSNKGSAFDVQSASADMSLTLNGALRSPSDTITVSDSSLATFQTYQFNANNLERSVFIIFAIVPSAHINYSQIEKVIVNAGSGNDTFVMTNTAQPSLTLNGGGGSDTIDYSAFTTSVTVNLALGTANKVSALSNVENVTGGASNDILVGDSNNNVLKGLGGRDLLIGGLGADQIFGGAGQDIEIAGATDFDARASDLATIRSTWAGAGNTLTRVNQLKLGVGAGGAIQLNDLTVHVTGSADDAARDQLFSDDDGASGAPNTADWFWANPGNGATQDQLTLLTGDFYK
jgi:hypothetical protein